MADIEIKLKTAEGSETTYENFEILSWTTTTTCTSDPSSPIFDVFPNSGQVVLKDTKLELYENAIMGVYDNSFNFELDIYIDDEKIAHHIVNQQPYYNYEDKTLTFNLGNELDITNELVYEGYTYPLEEENLYLVFLKIMTSLFSLSINEIEIILGKTYDIIFDEATRRYFNRSFKAYFNTLTIEYPYLSSKPQREVLKNLLTLAKCCMYQDENKKPVLVRMDGGFEQSVDFDKEIPSTIYDNVNFVLPNQINKGFVPSIIQKNNYNIAEISCNRVDIVSNKGVGFKNYYNVDDGTRRTFLIEKETDSLEYSIVKNSLETTLFDFNTSNTLSSVGMIIPEAFDTISFEIKVPKKTNQNLSTLLNISDFSFLMQQGTFSKTPYTGTINLNFYSDSNAGGWFVYSYNENSRIGEPEISNLNNFVVSKQIYYNYKNQINNKSVAEKNLVYTFPCGEPLIELKSETETEFIVQCSNILIGYTFYIFDINNHSTTFDGYYAKLENAPFNFCKMETSKVQISFLGDTYDIEFSGETVSVAPNSSTIQNPNKLVVANGGGLMQHTGDITSTSFPVQYGLDLLGWAKGGIKTGQLTVIKDQYTNAKDEVIVGNENHKIFKVGDLIVPCKDYNYNPIISDSDGNPVIYKVVEATTYGEGGAVFQDLKVRQVKPKKAEELPYYLVANDTGITICIRENGYATEGSNNQIIQIAWQT